MTHYKKIEERYDMLRQELGEHHINTVKARCEFNIAYNVKKEVLDLACEWLEENLTDDNDPQRAMWIKFIETFREEMEK